MKSIVIADTHFVKVEDLQILEEVGFIAREFADGTAPPEVLFLGDVFDTPRPSGETFVKFFEWLGSFTRDGGRVTIIVGNHDVSVNSSLLSVADHLENVRVVVGTTFFEDYDCDVNYLLVPWQPGGLGISKETLKSIEKSKNDTFVLGHIRLSGAKTASGFMLEAGESLPTSSKIVGGLLGDIHSPQKVGKFSYVGSARSTSFDERHVARVVALDGKKTIPKALLGASKSYTLEFFGKKGRRLLHIFLNEAKPNAIRGNRFRIRLDFSNEDGFDDTVLRKTFKEARDLILEKPSFRLDESVKNRVLGEHPSVASFVKELAQKSDRKRLLAIAKRIGL